MRTSSLVVGKLSKLTAAKVSPHGPTVRSAAGPNDPPESMYACAAGEKRGRRRCPATLMVNASEKVCVRAGVRVRVLCVPYARATDLLVELWPCHSGPVSDLSGDAATVRCIAHE
jgi:hypothetical protein